MTTDDAENPPSPARLAAMLDELHEVGALVECHDGVNQMLTLGSASYAAASLSDVVEQAYRDSATFRMTEPTRRAEDGARRDALRRAARAALVREAADRERETRQAAEANARPSRQGLGARRALPTE